MAGSPKKRARRAAAKAAGTTHTRSKTRGAASRKRKRQTLLKDLRDQAARSLDQYEVPDVRPEVALQDVLNRAYAYMMFYESIVAEIPEDKLWEVTINGRIPHHALRAAETARAEVAAHAARALDIGLEGRKVALAEETAAVLINFIEGVASKLDLTPPQQRKLAGVLREQATTLTAPPPDVPGTATELRRQPSKSRRKELAA